MTHTCDGEVEDAAVADVSAGDAAGPLLAEGELGGLHDVGNNGVNC